MALPDLDVAGNDSTPLPASFLQDLARAKVPADTGANDLPNSLQETLAKLRANGDSADTLEAGTVSAATVSRAAGSPALASTTQTIARPLSSSNSSRAAGAAAVLSADAASLIDIEMAAVRFDAAGLNGGQNKTTPAISIETRQLLREIGFDRVSDPNSSQSPPAVLAHGMAAQPNGTAATNTVPVLQLHTPMTKPEWADGLSERIVWLTDQNLSNAQIKLNPPHLGPIEVSVSVSDDQTNVSFMAHHAATRDALEAAAPRLREVLGSHGLGTINVNINQQSSSERSTQGQGYDAWHSFDPPAFETTPTVGAIRPAARTLIDIYA